MSILDPREIGAGLTTNAVPKINKTLKILLPTTYPIAMSDFFLKAATRDVASSGREVPTATIVTPIIRSDIPAIVAIPTAPSTKILPPPTRPQRPRTIKIMDLGIE